MMKKRKIRRGGKTRHPMQIQDAKMMSKTQDKKKDYAHIKSSSVEIWDTFPLSVLPSLRRKLKQSMRGKTMGSTT